MYFNLLSFATPFFLPHLCPATHSYFRPTVAYLLSHLAFFSTLPTKGYLPSSSRRLPFGEPLSIFCALFSPVSRALFCATFCGG